MGSYGIDLIEDEHHIFARAGYVYARQLFQDLFSDSIAAVGHFLDPIPMV